MHYPESNPSLNTNAPEGDPKVRNYDELKYGQTYTPPAQAPITMTEQMKKFLRTDDSSFWTGMLVGGAVAFFLTSDTVKRAIVKSFVKVSEEAKEGIKKVKKAVAKEKEPTKTEEEEKE